jgi:hypothetical protein
MTVHAAKEEGLVSLFEDRKLLAKKNCRVLTFCDVLRSPHFKGFTSLLSVVGVFNSLNYCTPH